MKNCKQVEGKKVLGHCSKKLHMALTSKPLKNRFIRIGFKLNFAVSPTNKIYKSTFAAVRSKISPCKRPHLTRSNWAILFDVPDTEAMTEDAVGLPAINTN